MAIQFVLPQLGESVTSGTVVNVLVTAGQKVEVNETILEIETDKAIAEVPSDFDGVVKEIQVQQGDDVSPGDVILTYEAGDGEAAAEAESTPAEEPTQVTAEQPAPAPVAEEKSAPDRAAEIAAASRAMADAPEAAITPPPQPLTALDALAPDSERAILPAAPSTRRFAREIGIDLRDVKGSGPAGRISVEDVKAYAKQLNEGRATAAPSSGLVADIPLPDFSRFGEVERQPMAGIRRATAEHLSRAWATIPHVTQFDKADVTDLETNRRAFAPQVERAGAKLTVTSILLKVVAAALKKFPQFNSSVDMVNREIVYKKYVHIGIAVDTEHGLMVPVIRDVDRKSVTELSLELGEIAEKTRQRKLSPDDMQGGCFTISNLGGIGGTGFTPIVNAPEVAILGVSRTQVEAVWQDDGVQPRQMLPLALSYDHRVIDGADGIRFLRWIVQALENPFVLFMEG